MENIRTEKNIRRTYAQSENYEIKNNVSNRKFQNEIPNLFYANLDKKISWPLINTVEKDLRPFERYLDIVIKNIKQLRNKCAECKEYKTTQLLKPNFSLIKIDERKSSFFRINNEKYYSITLMNLDKDISIVYEKMNCLALGRNDVINDLNKCKLDIYGDKIFIKNDKILDCDKNYLIWMRNEDSPISAKISLVNFSNIKDYKILSLDSAVEIENVKQKENGLTVYYKGLNLQKIELFDNIILEAKKVDSNFNVSKICLNKGKKIKQIESNLFVVSPKLKNDEKIKYENELLNWAPCTSNELIFPELKSKDENLLYNSEKNQFQYTSILNKDLQIDDFYSFTFLNQNNSYKKKYKEEGVLVELFENDEYSDDINSNTSYFFGEDVSELRDCEDLENNSCRRFEIGRSYKDDNIIEIVELVGKKNRKIKPKSIPEFLYIEPNLRQLSLQKNAIQSLKNRPYKEQVKFYNLFDKKSNYIDQNHENNNEIEKFFLIKNSNEFSEKQQLFVRKALNTDDFAFLDGPPGSGKTTVILELIAQIIHENKKILLVASTHAAIDNILERLDKLPNEITNKLFPVRIGSKNNISELVQNYCIDDFSKDEQSILLKNANLVCGTTIGILQHPLMNFKRYQPAIPLYDYMVIDEASKTVFTEFLVPALFAKKWIISGDIKQLTPYVDSKNLEENLKYLKDFDEKKQLIFSILQFVSFNTGKGRFLCVVPDVSFFENISELIEEFSSIHISILSSKDDNFNPKFISKDEYNYNPEKTLEIYYSDIVFINYSILDKIVLPNDFIIINPYKKEIPYEYRTRQIGKLNNKTYYFNKTKEQKKLEDYENSIYLDFKENPIYKEVAWRLCRINELFLLEDRDKQTIDKYESQIKTFLPKNKTLCEKINKQINELKYVALPSVMQIFEYGINKKISQAKATTFNSGFGDNSLNLRKETLKYQFRMHPDIAKFSRENIYKNKSLIDGQVNRDWSYNNNMHLAWIDCESKNTSNNYNNLEVKKIISDLKVFLEYTKNNKRSDKKNWSVAILSYYRKQDSEIKKAVKALLNESRVRNCYICPQNNIEISIYTVDKFQGNEADLVYLSLVKSGSVGLGFMDSPNRLNVALTRARYCLKIVGDRDYFSKNKKSEILKKLADSFGGENVIKK